MTRIILSVHRLAVGCRTRACNELRRRYATPPKPDLIGTAHTGTDQTKPSVGFCDGFRMPALHRCRPRAPRADVRKPPGKEGAGEGAPGSVGSMGNWRAWSAQRERRQAASIAVSSPTGINLRSTSLETNPMTDWSDGFGHESARLGPSAAVAGHGPAAKSIGSDR